MVRDTKLTYKDSVRLLNIISLFFKIVLRSVIYNLKITFLNDIKIRLFEFFLKKNTFLIKRYIQISQQ